MSLPQEIKEIFQRQIDMLPDVDGRSYTRSLRVSPNGSGRDGQSWEGAYATLTAALDAASTNPNEYTKILLPGGTFDINLPGDPTWGANVCIQGSHRNWPKIVNTHAAATSVLNLTGDSCLSDVTIDCGTGDINGLKLTGDGARIRRLYVECENATGAQTALELTGEYARGEDVMVHGVVGFTRGLLLNGCHLSNFEKFGIHECLTGIQWLNAADHNHFDHIDVENCALGMDIDSGSEQDFENIDFHGNTRNVDDEVGDHNWAEIHGAFDIAILPDTVLAGTVVSTDAAADTWGLDTELLAAGGRDNPFRIVGVHMAPSAAGTFQVRFSDDGGTTFYDVLQTTLAKREATAAPSGTEHIFNAGTRISASSRSDTGNDDVDIWIEIQEI